jgi:hypothetical protein
MSVNSIKRSETYQRLFADEFMLAAFGKLNPSRSERTLYFFEKWCEWHQNNFKIFPVTNTKMTEIRHILDNIGLREFWDYQLRNGEIRFSDAESLAFFKISAGGLLS